MRMYRDLYWIFPVISNKLLPLVFQCGSSKIVDQVTWRGESTNKQSTGTNNNLKNLKNGRTFHPRHPFYKYNPNSAWVQGCKKSVPLVLVVQGIKVNWGEEESIFYIFEGNSFVITLSDKISADKTAENLTCCRKFCPPKSFVHRKLCPPKYFVH